MKTGLIILLSLICFNGVSQYTADDFRIVDGQLYNIRRSVKWEEIASGNTFDEYYTRLVVRRIMEDGSLYCDQESYDTRQGGGTFLSGVDRLILKRYPGDVHIGSDISSCWAMRLPNKPGDAINTYDYGLPNTPENRKMLNIQPVIPNTQKTASTNLITTNFPTSTNHIKISEVENWRKKKLLLVRSKKRKMN